MGNSREGVGSNSVVQEQPSLEDVGDALGKLRTLLAKQETPSDFGNALVDLVERHIVAQVGSEAKAVFNEARAVQLLEDLEQSRDVQKIITITEQLETLAKENPEYVERFAERMSEKLREELALPSYRQNKELIGSIGSSLMTMEAEDSKALGILIHLYVRRPPEECPGILQYLVSKGERTTQSLGNQLKFDDLDPVSRARICLALSEIGNVESLNILREETETSREPEQRLIALNMLAHAAMKGSPYDYDSLLPLLTEVCEAFAEVAEIRSGPGKKSFCVDPLSSQVSAHEVLWRQDIQHDYARALASFGSDASIATLTEVLRNFDEIEVADLAGMILGVQSRRSTPLPHSIDLLRKENSGQMGEFLNYNLKEDGIPIEQSESTHLRLVNRCHTSSWTFMPNSQNPVLHNLRESLIPVREQRPLPSPI
ncbi:MAG: hypothetical protein KDD70_09330 [Bdellovibrionales bacterium]|nr:hypothetical protein [Bdellovibrionales bacterium]